MIAKNIADIGSLADLEVAPGVYFNEHTWKIRVSDSEHKSFYFSRILDCYDARITDYPDLLLFAKILTFYMFPESPLHEIRSWNSTERYFEVVSSLIGEFFYKKFFVTKELISNVDPIQLEEFLNIVARSADHSAKFLRLSIGVTRVLKIWGLASDVDAMPDWARANFSLSQVVSKEFEKKQKEINDGKNEAGWMPLNPHQIKTSYDAAYEYIYRFSRAIIDVGYLVKTRPTTGSEGNRLGPVRKDGRTKYLFKKLEKFEIPKFTGTNNTIFELPTITRKVKSLGYKSGYQDRTWIEIASVRPQVVELKRACIFIIGLLTGLRRKEIANLKVNALFVRDATDYLKITRFKTASDPKKGTDDTIPVPKIVADAVRVLEELFELQRSQLNTDYLLVTDIVTGKGFKKVKESTIGKDVKAFITESSGDPGHTHQLRKTIAWLLISKSEENVDLIRQLFGHKSYGMTLQYIMRNELLSGSVIELLEENYTEDLQDVLTKISSGEAVGELAKAVNQRSVHYYPGQILASEVESFVHSALESGVPLFISKVPIGGFCVSASDLSKKRPPCIADTDDEKPNPEFCDYINCPHVLHTTESMENVRQQITFYERKLKHLPEVGDDRVEEYYTAKIDENKALLESLKSVPLQKKIIATDAVNG